MKCDYDCLHCKFPDCIKNEKQTNYNPEVKRSYYQRHREEILARQNAYNKAHKAERHEYSKKRWENMTEEQRLKERVRLKAYGK